MSAMVEAGHDARYRVGWIALLVTAGLMSLNHLVLAFVLDEPTLFMGFAAFNLYALVVIAIPFRRRQTWAWFASWILPIGLAAPAFTDPNLAVFYYTAAAVCVVGLLLTMRVFFAGDRLSRGHLSERIPEASR